MSHICIVVATEATITAFLLDQLRALSRLYRVTVVANAPDPIALRRRGIDVDIVPLGIERKISVLRDVKALVALWRLLRTRRFSVVHSVTPKAGLLAMLAGAAAGVPVRIHTFTGQVWATRSGWIRTALRQADKIIARTATIVLADSWSQRDFLVAERVVTPERITVLGAGSISGVDLGRFHADPVARMRVRKELSLPERAVVFLYLGRVNRDKGVLDLGYAFSEMAPLHTDAFLVVAGLDEERLTPELLRAVEMVSSRVRVVGFTDRPEQMMAAADVYCLPSYREGFGSTVIEAAATGLPAIASRIYGLTDSVEEGVTGLLHRPGSVRELAELMCRLAGDSKFRLEMGENARVRAVRDFAQERLTDEVLRLYHEAVTTGGAA